MSITEKEYRRTKRNSSSSVKDFSLDRRKYYKKYVLGDFEEDSDSIATKMGQLVETLLMEPERFDDLFYMSACVAAPTGLMGAFVETLAKKTVENTSPETGGLTIPFGDVTDMAYKESGFKISVDKVIEKFEGSDAEIYYGELVKVRFNDLIVVTPNDVNNAENIVAELKNNPFTNFIINLTSGKKMEVINQMKIMDFELFHLPLKAMLDKVIIDHTYKTIQFYDLKCTWNVEQFFKEYYLYRRAYIQAGIYYEACKSLTTKEGSPYFGYKVELPKFIVCDSINYYSPLIYSLTQKDLDDAFNGFELRGYRYPGIKEIIEDMLFAFKKDIWNISRTNYNNYGVVPLEY